MNRPIYDIAGRFAALDIKIEATWHNIFANSNLIRAIKKREIDKALYAIYLIETYHYSLHNGKSQAMAALRPTLDPQLAKFYLAQASIAIGREKMVLADLNTLSCSSIDLTLPTALPETETLIAYLYWVSSTGNVVRSLGYSYWMNNCYNHINPLIYSLKEKLNLEASQLSFIIAHSNIDTTHFIEIKNLIASTCKMEQDWNELEDVAINSLCLTGQRLEAIFSQYQQYHLKNAGRYEFLRALLEEK